MTHVRRLFASLNLLVVLFLLGALFIMVNWVASRRYARWDVTQQQLSALSDKTVQTLHSLKEPVSVVVLFQPTHRLYEMIKDELNEYARRSSLIRVEYVDPEQDAARTQQLAQQFQLDAANLVIVQSGTHHKQLSETAFAEYDYRTMGLGGEPRVKAFKGEEALTAALLNVTQAESPLVWVTTGHKEKSMDATTPDGLTDFKKALAQQNMSPSTVTLLEHQAIPKDVTLVIIPGPIRRFTESELLLLQAYLERGGKMLALIDPLVDSGLDGLLERWGINIGLDVVVDPARQLPFVSAANLFVTTYTHHPIVEKMKTLMTLFPLARSVRPAQSASPELTVTPLALTSDSGWGETTTSSDTFKFDKDKDLKGPVSIAVAVERKTPSLTRLVVIGDSDFIANAQLSNVGNRDLFLGAVSWLAQQEHLIGIGPRSIESIKLHLTRNQLTGMLWLSLLAMPLSCGVLGALMWWMRRT